MDNGQLTRDNFNYQLFGDRGLDSGSRGDRCLTGGSKKALAFLGNEK
ncbi:MAG: hypothetical protein O9326_21400 [Microcystis sp. LE19-338.1B]|jgi:hypothetical protein|nr:hypothetical protein [Microcystis sp. LE19-338.1B]MCZ8360965.1 hypothetical protein [Microcystis sp. LE19-388.1G]